MINCEQTVQMLIGASGRIKADNELLSRLDSHGGDGDHGTTMVRAMDCLERAVRESQSAGMKKLLQNVGWSIMGVDGGATGPLFGSFFMGMSDALGEQESVDSKLLATMCESGLKSVMKLTKAQVGDKTMLDALVPGVWELRNAANEKSSMSESLKRAACAAERGARTTDKLQARFGRAKNLGEKSIGQPDAGATSVALMFRGFAEGVNADG